ncbi:hypothetical protein JCM10212_006486 [Sporobolomyces blumeae]
MSAALLLSLYVSVDTTRALLVFGALRSGVELSASSLTFGAEVVKLVVAVIGVLSTSPSQGPRFLLASRAPGESWLVYLKPYLRFAIPAALYGCNNVLYLTGLRITSPALLQVSVLTKLPLTALLHHVVIRRRRSRPMWISLAVLTVGLVLAGSPEALWDSTQRRAWSLRDLVSGPLIGFSVGIISACSSVYTELALKEDIGFWQAQLYLYVWGALFAGVAATLSNINTPMRADSTIASLPAFTIVVIVTAATGLVVAVILRQRDNLVKLVGSSLCITTVFIFQHLLFPLTEGLSFRTTFGVGVLTLATWTYNHYKSIDDLSVGSSSTANYVELSTSEQSSPRESKTDLTTTASSSPLSDPNSSPAIVVRDAYAPTSGRLAVALAVVIGVSSLTALQPAAFDSRSSIDVRAYFARVGIAPSAWTTVVGDPDCVSKSLEGVDLEESSHDANAVMAKAGCPVFPMPDEGLFTHLFWAGEWRIPAFSLTTDAWLATQRLSANHRLIWWYENAGPPSSFVERYTALPSPYSGSVEFRPFNESLARGTCLDEMREWTGGQQGERIEAPETARTDLIKLLILEKIGGVWLDVDSVPLKDLTEVLRAGPGVPVRMNSIRTDLIIAGPTWGGGGRRVLETACGIPFDAAERFEKFPDLQWEGGQLATYSEGVFHACEATGCGVSRLPADWLLAHTRSGEALDPCERDRFPLDSTSTLRFDFDGSFVWSTGMSSRQDDDSCWDDDQGTLLSVVRRRVDEVLKLNEGEAGDGVDLFPVRLTVEDPTRLDEDVQERS